MKTVIKAGFVSSSPDWAWWRQFPQGDLVWDGVGFFFGEAPSDCDCLFVFDALPYAMASGLDPQRLIFVASEPSNVKRYDAAFLAQFGRVLTTDRETPHRNRYFTQVGLPWHVGAWNEAGALLEVAMTLRDFELFRPAKTKLVSVVSSNKAFTDEHRARLGFVAELKRYFGDQIDVFGRGINDFGDKVQVLASYRYHIALENCAIKDYWTEKLADPFLTLTYPIYHGCPNVEDYFPHGSLTSIDINEPQIAIASIKRIIESNLAEQAQPLLEQARRQVLYEHNLFALLARVAKETVDGQRPVAASPMVLRPESSFQPLKERLRQQVVRVVKRVPVLHRAACGARDGLKRSQDLLREARDVHYRSHQAWLKKEPDESARYAYDLTTESHVLDVGGFKGDFAAKLIAQYGLHVTVFEPIPQFANVIRSRFAGEPRVTLVEAALADQDGDATFSIDDDASGAFASGMGGAIRVRLVDAARYVEDNDVEYDLAKLNIEGGEYALLERLIKTGHINRLKNLQVQFHLNVPWARRRYRKLARRLRKTHILVWRYPFVWESWTRREV